MHAVVGEAVELVRDAAPDFEPQPGDGADHQDIDADTVLERVQQRRHAFVDKADRANLNADKFRVFVWHDRILHHSHTHRAGTPWRR